MYRNYHINKKIIRAQVVLLIKRSLTTKPDKSELGNK